MGHPRRLPRPRRDAPAFVALIRSPARPLGRARARRLAHRRAPHDVGHLLEEQPVVALDLGEALLHQLLLLQVLAQVRVALRRLVVNRALHLGELAPVVLLAFLHVARVALLVAHRDRAAGAVHPRSPVAPTLEALCGLRGLGPAD